MRDLWNPHALPFQPGGFDDREQNFGAFENQHLPPPPQGFGGHYDPPSGPWNGNALPPPPPHMFPQPQTFSTPQAQHLAAWQHAQAYHQWLLHTVFRHHATPPPNFPPGSDAFAGRPPHMQPHGPPPFGPPSYGPPPFMHQQQRQMSTDRAQNHMMNTQTNPAHGVTNENMHAPPLQGHPSESGSAANGHDIQNGYDALHRIASQKAVDHRINKRPRPSRDPKPSIPVSEKKGRYGDKKIMLPAPQPTEEYMAQAAGEPSTNETPSPMLVILDLNGTVLYRPNRNAKTMIQRPFLRPFLRYLFDNFKVMVWSSARPDNVRALVNQALDNELRSKLVAQWARDSFGLSPTNYQQNVQVYKNLKLIWSRSQIQSYHPEFETGGRFGQHNTVLIDDSALKASAQPYNLLEIPEFSATPEQMQGDVLREVAGYLEALKYQSDVSKFIRKHPFVEGGPWKLDWPDDAADGGEMTPEASAPPPSKKKEKKKKAKAAAAAAAAAADQTSAPLVQTSLPQTAHSSASEPLGSLIQKDW